MAKRKVYWWWQCTPPALCPECKVPCVSNGTVRGTIQYRVCPLCGFKMQTTIPNGHAQNSDELESGHLQARR